MVSLHPSMRRRRLLGTVGAGSLALLSARLSRPAWAQAQVDLHAPGAPSLRPMTTAYPQKGPMILQRTSPPWLETPFKVFDKGVFTPNDQHYVSWHWATFPSEIDVGTFRLTVRGHVNQTLSLSLDDLLHGMPRVELAAVSQCAGNSRIYMQPRVAGAQWANDSMSNALWGGVRLKDVLDRAGVKAGAVQVYCDIHSDMRGDIIVAPTRRFARIGPGGSFRIEDVPPGDHTVKVWLSSGTRSSAVQVPERGTATLSTLMP